MEATYTQNTQEIGAHTSAIINTFEEMGVNPTVALSVAASVLFTVADALLRDDRLNQKILHETLRHIGAQVAKLADYTPEELEQFRLLTDESKVAGRA